ncbi:MAG: hypothetical protein H6Q05_3346 [Acidobacteria bacterium]|jgi:hypothetical protein|nr:hypothetical protein [Acidobacteriota bacterium]
MAETMPLSNSIIVVAHPDDEVLWFGSLLREIDRVVIVFQDYDADPALGIRRGKAIKELPFAVTCLAIPEAGSWLLADWFRPKISPYGLALRVTPLSKHVSSNYEKNFRSIRACLKRQLSSDMNVFTHNPWGEYGHEDHVQVFRVIESLRAEIGFTLHVSGYYSARSRTLAAYYTDCETISPICRSIDSRYAHGIAELYKRHGCWTWAEDWVWPQDECFIGPPVLRGEGNLSSHLPNFSFLYEVPSSGDAPRVN